MPWSRSRVQRRIGWAFGVAFNGRLVPGWRLRGIVRRRGVAFKFFVVFKRQEGFVVQEGLIVQEGFFRDDAVEAVLLESVVIAVAVNVNFGDTLIVAAINLGGVLVAAAIDHGVALIRPTDARGQEQAHTFVELSQPLQELFTVGRGRSSRQVVNLALQVAEVSVPIVARGIEIADLAQRRIPADLAVEVQSGEIPLILLWGGRRMPRPLGSYRLVCHGVCWRA